MSINVLKRDIAAGGPSVIINVADHQIGVGKSINLTDIIDSGALTDNKVVFLFEKVSGTGTGKLYIRWYNGLNEGDYITEEELTSSPKNIHGSHFRLAMRETSASNTVNVNAVIKIS